MRRRICTSGIQSNSARAGVMASDSMRKMTAQSPVECVATVTGRGSRSPLYQRQASSSAGRQSPISVTRRSQKIFCLAVTRRPYAMDRSTIAQTFVILSSSSPVIRGRIQEGESRTDDLSKDEIMI